jgi:Calcineurin-like phosphoesterase
MKSMIIIMNGTIDKNNQITVMQKYFYQVIKYINMFCYVNKARLMQGLLQSNKILVGSVILSLISMIIIFISVYGTTIEKKSAYAADTSLNLFNFAAAGDWACTSDTINTVKNIIYKNPELILGLGDYSYENTADCWLNIVNLVDEKMKISIGNHEDEYNSNTSLSLLNQYMSHFGLTKQYYSFNYQNIHFVVMSTELPLEEGSEQYNFVNSDLANAASDPNVDWIVVYYHKAIYFSPLSFIHTAKDYELFVTLRDTYHPLFSKYHVDIVLQGHNHNYERSYPIMYNSIGNSSNPIITDTNKNNYNNPEGQIFAIVGTGGHNQLFNFTGKAPYIAEQYYGFGFLNLDVINGGTFSTIRGNFYANDETVKDKFTITKSTISS